MIPHCSTACLVGISTPYRLEQSRGLLEVVDDVVDLRRELIDVVTVEGRHVLRVQERDQLPRDHVAFGLLRLDLLLRDPRVRMLAESPLDEPRHLERVLAGLAEQREELGGARSQAEPHAGGTLTNWRYFGAAERGGYASASTTSDWKCAISRSDSGSSRPSSIIPACMPGLDALDEDAVLGADLRVELERLLDPRLVGVLRDEVVEEAVRPVDASRDDRADREVRAVPA